jgi:haloacetate dehalogenase
MAAKLRTAPDGATQFAGDLATGGSRQQIRRFETGSGGGYVPSSVPLQGFEDGRVSVGEASYFVARGGAGPPLLLLHGFPETHLCWHRVAPQLTTAHEVITPDLRGYGASEAPAGGPHGEGYSKREMASELVELMGSLGHERFAVVGHDRGARVAYRLALDHPDRVTRVALLNVIPTIEQFERMAEPSLGYWTWFLLAQPVPFPERMLGGDPDGFLDHIFATWPSDPDAIPPENRSAYRQALTPATVAAMCGDFRASFHLDRQDDAEDRAAGRRITAPALLVTGEDETQLADAPGVWQAWAEDLTSTQTPGGHFIPEEAPEELVGALTAFLERDEAG